MPSQSRDDLALGVSVSLTNNDNTGVLTWFWEFVSRPVGSSAVISGSALPTASFVPDVRGSYLIKLTVDGSPSNPATDTRIAAVKTAFLGIRKPATSERKEFDATDGWSAAQQAMIDAIDSDASISLKRNGSNTPNNDISWNGFRLFDLGGLYNEGVMRLGETTNPSAVPDKGFLYAKDDSGDTELFWMDDSGAIVQVTKDGQLDVVSLQGDALPSKTAGGFLKRNAGNTGWEEVVYGTGANTVCQGNDSRLSDSRPPTGAASGQLGGTYPGPDVRGIRETAGPTLLTIGAVSDGQILKRDGSALIGAEMSTGGKVKIRVDDIADGYLHEKLLTGPGLSFAIGNPGGNETLTLDAYGEVRISENDTDLGYLSTKLVAGSNITLTVLDDGYDESLEISTSGGNTLGLAYNQGGAGAGRAITANAGAVEINASGANALKLDGYLTLQEISTPASLANKGLAYSQDDGGDTELFYRDDKSRSTQLTRDGYLAPHAILHESGGTDPIKLDELAAPTDVTTLNSTVAAHGLLPKLSGSPGDALRGDGTWGVVSSDGYNVKISATDTTPDYLQQKLVAGNNIELTRNNPGGDETLTVATSEALKLVEQAFDPTPFLGDGYLYSKNVDGYAELFYMDDYGNVLQISRIGRLNLPDGYGFIGFRYDELGPAWTTGAETSLTLASLPVDGYALFVFRNGMLMRPVDALGGSDKQEFIRTDNLVEFLASGQPGDWYSALYIDAYGYQGVDFGSISFKYDELRPSATTGAETSLVLAAAPVDGYALHMFRNGMLMRPVDVLEGSDKQEFTRTGNQIDFVASGQPGDWYSALYIDGYMFGGGGGGGGSLDTSYDFGGPGAGRTITVDAGAVKLDAAGENALEIDGYLTLAEKVSDPSPLEARGLMYAKDASGHTELFYMDDYGKSTQITADGYLDTLESLRGVGMFVQTADPVQAPGKGVLYTKETEGLAELFYRNSDGDILQVSKAGRFDLPDGYISFRYDELGPANTTGAETSLTLAAVPVDGYALQVHRNGMLMRPVDTLGGSDKQEFVRSGDQVEFVASGQPGDWYSAFYIDGYMLVGAGGSVKQNVAMANNQGTDSASDTVVGAFPIAAGDYPSRTVKFLATAFVTGAGLTGYVKLYNVTDSALVQSFSFTGVTTAKQISSALNLPVDEKMYEIRISVTGGSGPSDRVVCMWAGLQIG